MQAIRVLLFGLSLCSWAVMGWMEAGGLLLPPRVNPDAVPAGWTLVARLAQISDTHLVDEESPARFPGAHMITHSAWRPFEAYSAQLLDGAIRTVNRMHASGRTIDFLLHTGDFGDNAQQNELDWFFSVMDGDEINPLTGPDDRPTAPEARSCFEELAAAYADAPAQADAQQPFFGVAKKREPTS